MTAILAEIDASIQSKLDTDTDFLSSIASLSDEEKTQKMEEKKSELRETELAEMKGKADRTTKAEEVANNQKIRAEKAEAAAKSNSSASQGDLSQTDLLYIAKANIPEEDLAEVIEYSKLKKISVKDAQAFLQPVLDVNAEKRRTAAATHTGGGGRGSSKETGADLLAKAKSTGEVPDTDEGMNELFKARQATKVRNRTRK